MGWPADTGSGIRIGVVLPPLRARRPSAVGTSAGSNLRATAGKSEADSSPAASSEAAVVGVIFPEATPIWVATITKVRVVACISPASPARRLPMRRT